MAKVNSQKTASGSAFDSEAQLWAAIGNFLVEVHPDLRADFVPVRKGVTYPPFSLSDWGGENLRQDRHRKFGMPPVNNTDYTWVQHFKHTKFRTLGTLLAQKLGEEPSISYSK